ncbi:MAG: RNB domain-containing ribonuclease [Eubacterium sp.]|nr:RNB domain-containing ribonuclease [Eubacterium sp.]
MNEKQLFEQRKNSIKELISGQDYMPMKFKELAYLLGVPQEERQDFRKLMDALVEEGSVDLTSRGKYIRPQNRNLTGIFTGHPKGFGFVSVEGEPEDIFIPAEYVNGAFYMDKVLVKVKRESAASGRRPEGMILKILERGAKTVTGTFEKGDSYGFVRPDDRRFGTDIHVGRKHFAGARHRDKVVARITDYGSEKKKPEGRIIEVLGSIDDPATDVSSVIHAYGIEEAFSRAVYQEAENISQEISRRDLEGRKDWRDKLTVTIDGEDARDLDDAISLETNEDGYLLGVHIADVSHYVRENSPLDQSALARGTSVYLTDRVIPMLPRELSNGICSLNQGVDRLALSCIMQLDSQGNVIDHRIEETVIRVDRRMSYTGVQAILTGADFGSDGEAGEGEKQVSDKICRENTAALNGKRVQEEKREIVNLCFLMRDVAALLKEKRRKRGAIDFDFPESKITLDDQGIVSRIAPYTRNTATDIIEDFMLLANETVAQDYFWQEIPFLYRTHEAPDPDRLKKLDLFIRNFGYYLKTGRETFHPKEIQKLLFSLEGEPEEALVSRLALRSMKQARYTTMNVGHFGLSTQYYTHFTSPIRRYPDLQIHRIIKENLHGRLTEKRLSHYEEILPAVAEESSRLERRAQNAERDVEKLKKIEYMQGQIGTHYSGVISGVTAVGFYVELDNTVEGMVPVATLLDDYYHFEEENYQLIGEVYGRVFTLGQPVEIVVEAADKMRRTIDFSLAEFHPGLHGREPDPELLDLFGIDSASGRKMEKSDIPKKAEDCDDLNHQDENNLQEENQSWEEDEYQEDQSLEEDNLIYDEKTGIAVNDWLSDEEADRLLNLYAQVPRKK